MIFSDAVGNLHPARVKSSILLLHLVDLEAVVPTSEGGVRALHTFDPLLNPAGAPVLQTAALLSPNGTAVQQTSRVMGHVDTIT